MVDRVSIREFSRDNEVADPPRRRLDWLAPQRCEAAFIEAVRPKDSSNEPKHRYLHQAAFLGKQSQGVVPPSSTIVDDSDGLTVVSSTKATQRRVIICRFVC